jgi:hypothetical protein
MNTPVYLHFGIIRCGFCVVFLTLLSCNIAYSQKSFGCAGNELTGTTGKISYSVGQPYILEISGTNGSSINGMQQPFSVYTLGIDDNFTSQFQISVYPNPVQKMLVLTIGDEVKGKFEYSLYSIDGTMIDIQPVIDRKAQINMDGLKADMYLLKVLGKGRIIKSIKIVKN